MLGMEYVYQEVLRMVEAPLWVVVSLEEVVGPQEGVQEALEGMVEA